ncbi:MAG: response regulator [Cyanobacteria bacterium P01_A01_bin.3]
MTSSFSDPDSNQATFEFDAGGFVNTLELIRSKGLGGVFSATVDMPARSQARTKFLIFEQGALTYGCSQIPSPEEFVISVGRRLNVSNIDIGIKLAAERWENDSSIHELVDLLTRMSIFEWGDVEKVAFFDTLMILEQLAPYSGKLVAQPSINFDLSYQVEKRPLRWTRVQEKLDERQRRWGQLRSLIPSVDSVPTVNESAARAVQQPEFQKVRPLLNGQRSLSEIAEILHIDALSLAKYCAAWRQAGQIELVGLPSLATARKSTPSPGSQSPASQSPVNSATVSSAPTTSPPATENIVISDTPGKPIILSVDDSPIVQTMIKRVLSERYELLLASNAVDALNIINKHSISLLLLDVTMPEIDGYELCKTIRNIGKFKTLPIVMLTAKDTMFDKVKGRFAGTDKYLTKPINSSELLAVVKEFIPYA